MTARSILLGATLALAIGLPEAARAELSCHDSLRGVQLQDPDVLSQAKAIARPLIESELSLRATIMSSVKHAHPNLNPADHHRC
jgi:hypothetical protein